MENLWSPQSAKILTTKFNLRASKVSSDFADLNSVLHCSNQKIETMPPEIESNCVRKNKSLGRGQNDVKDRHQFMSEFSKNTTYFHNM